MTDLPPSAPPFLESVVHASDFEPGSENAFAHALAIALIRRIDLTILHAGREALGEDEWTKFPGVRATLERWGLLEPGSPRSAVFDELAVRVKKVALRGLSPLGAMLDYLEENPTDLVVLGTEGRDGPSRWLRPSVGERLARRTRSLCLFVPKQSGGFVSLADGSLHLRRIVIPYDHRPDPSWTPVYATRVAEALGDTPVDVHLLHVGDDPPAIELPETPACTWHTARRSGDVVEEILGLTEAVDANLLILATAGHEGVLDAMRGSLTEQVLRRTPCPLLAVPAA